MLSDEGYYSFLAVAAGWASGSWIPLAMVLRNSCHWTLMDSSLPANAFVTEGGEILDPFDVLTMAETATNGSAAPGVRQSAEAILRTVLISGHAVRQLCETTRTIWPRRIPRSANRLLAAITRSNLAPPPCPEAEEKIRNGLAKQSATRLINQCRATLVSLQTEPKLERFWGAHAPSLEGWEERWVKTKDAIQADLNQCGDEDLSHDLQTLTCEWAAFITSERERSLALAATSVQSPSTWDGGEAAGCLEMNVPLGEHGRTSGTEQEASSRSAMSTEAPHEAAPEKEIAFAIDQERPLVAFESGISIRGAPARVVECLLRPCLQQSGFAGLGSRALPFTKAEVLAKQLNLTEPSLRQAIQRCRRSLSDQFRRRCGIELGQDDVIENRRWLGYRINPQLVFKPELLRLMEL